MMLRPLTFPERKVKMLRRCNSRTTLTAVSLFLAQPTMAAKPGIRPSTSWMPQERNCYDNAPMESFWGTLKSELIHHRRYRNRQEAIQEISEYIEVFYNRLRSQARLGYLSPLAYEQNLYKGKLVA